MESNDDEAPPTPPLTLENFTLPQHASSCYVLTSPRSLKVCRYLGLKVNTIYLICHDYLFKIKLWPNPIF